tara:strand:- start:602 stop:808 length:207 start_codon:yes stop_codon:yes gene_type:complete
VLVLVGEKVGVYLRPVSPFFRDIKVRENGGDGAHGLTSTAVDAFVRVNVIDLGFIGGMDTVHRAHVHA